MGNSKVVGFLIVVGVLVLFIFVSFSGCVTDEKTTENKFLGTWTGYVEMPMVGVMGNSSVSQVRFSDSGAELTTSSDRGTFTMNYTYTINENSLVLEPQFGGRGGPFNGRPSFNDSRPWNGTRPPGNGSWVPNGTEPPHGSWNGSQPPGNGQRSLSITFEYSFNEDYTLLYLNGAQFIKV